LINVVEFPATGTTSGLAFLSSNLIVLSSATCNYVVEKTPRALRVVAHEMAHRWFGGDLRPVGPGTRWLAESFAEYYAWTVVREQLGAEEYRKVIEEVTKRAGQIPTRILALGWDPPHP
jgi:aminopeptidase N